MYLLSMTFPMSLGANFIYTTVTIEAFIVETSKYHLQKHDSSYVDMHSCSWDNHCTLKKLVSMLTISLNITIRNKIIQMRTLDFHCFPNYQSPNYVGSNVIICTSVNCCRIGQGQPLTLKIYKLFTNVCLSTMHYISISL